RATTSGRSSRKRASSGITAGSLISTSRRAVVASHTSSKVCRRCPSRSGTCRICSRVISATLPTPRWASSATRRSIVASWITTMRPSAVGRRSSSISGQPICSASWNAVIVFSSAWVMAPRWPTIVISAVVVSGPVSVLVMGAILSGSGRRVAVTLWRVGCRSAPEHQPSVASLSSLGRWSSSTGFMLALAQITADAPVFLNAIRMVQVPALRAKSSNARRVAYECAASSSPSRDTALPALTPLSSALVTVLLLGLGETDPHPVEVGAHPRPVQIHICLLERLQQALVPSAGVTRRVVRSRQPRIDLMEGRPEHPKQVHDQFVVERAVERLMEGEVLGGEILARGRLAAHLHDDPPQLLGAMGDVVPHHLCR